MWRGSNADKLLASKKTNHRVARDKLTKKVAVQSRTGFGKHENNLAANKNKMSNQFTNGILIPTS